MDIRKCRLCGTMYQFIRSPYCPDCMNKIEEQYQMVRDYLEEHPTARIPQVAKETKVSERIIMYLLREGRLTLATPSLNCERCKTTIDSGRYCGSCLDLLQRGLTEAQKAGMNSRIPAGQGSEQDLQGRRHTGRTGRREDDDSGMHIHRKNRRG